MLPILRLKSGLMRFAVVLAALATLMALREIAAAGSPLPPTAGCWPALVAGGIAVLPEELRSPADAGALT